MAKKQTATKTPQAKKTASQAGLFDVLDGLGPNAGTWVKRALLLLVVLFLALLVVWQVHAAHSRKTAKAYAELSKAVTADDYDRVAANYSGTNVSVEAELSAAERLFQNGSYKEAAERFANAAASSDNSTALRGTLGQAKALEATATAKDKTDKDGLAKAEKLYAKAAEQAATAGMSCEQVEALLGQSRCQRLSGDSAKARKTLEMAQKITDKPDDQLLAYLGRHVKESLSTIDTYELAQPAPAPEKAPEKAKTPAAPAPAPAEDGKAKTSK